MSSYFQKLKALTDSGRLKTYVIIAPPRTNSSLVEHAFGNSPDIEHECHEPFLNARHSDFDPDHGYQQIYKAIGGQEFEHSEGSTSVVVKEMSHWIAKNTEYKRLTEIVTEPIIILIRNPLLSVESRIRRVLVTMDMSHSLSLQRYLIDEIAIEKGFPDWVTFAKKMKEEGYKDRPNFLENKEAVERIYDVPVLTVQNHLLNLKARREGYANWRDLIDKKLYTERDYKFFEDILGSNGRRLEFEQDEFAKLIEEIEYFEENNKDYLVVDTTDFRAAPNEQMQELCQQLGVTFSPEMARWGEAPVNFHTEQTQEHERLWYDTLYASSRVNPPTEIPLTLDQFPTFMQTYLEAGNLPVYATLSKKKTLSEKLRRELNEQEMRVKVTDGNREHLCQLGLIEEKTVIGEHVVMKLKYVDPVYAITNDPELLAEPDFEAYKDVYASEIKIISKALVEEMGEHTQEIKRLGNEIKFR